MSGNRHRRQSRLAAALPLTLLAGCLQSSPRPASPPLLPGTGEPAATLKPSQRADIQVAMGRVFEKRGAGAQAEAAYLEALKHDPKRADACARLAVLYDRQGKFKESERLYGQGLAAQPQNPDLLCNRGYSLYLQRRWAEAEAALGRAVALAPDHQRAHNNLGLVLAHSGREDQALVEFRSAGCSDAAARVNLAFALALQHRLAEARVQYELALAADPTSVQAQAGAQQLGALLARASGATARAQASDSAEAPPPLPTSSEPASEQRPVSAWQPRTDAGDIPAVGGPVCESTAAPPAARIGAPRESPVSE
jgi:Tfp pilus assembly protein PilF